MIHLLDRSIEEVVKRAKEGNMIDRNQLIEQYRPFIIKSVSHICKRPISWNHDEASIGLIAFNKAIDRYDAAHGKTFENFAFMIIRNQLIDEFRKQGRILENEMMVLDDLYDEFDQTTSEIAISLEAYEREQTAAGLAQELVRYDLMLQEYGVFLEELEECSPKHKDTRKQFIQMAKHFGEQPEWLHILLRTKRLPIKEMLQFFKVSRKTLERNRKYLIALVLIYTCNEFEGIRKTVSFEEVGE